MIENERYFQIFSARLQKIASRFWKKIHPLTKRQISRTIESHGSEYGGWTLCPTGLGQESVVFSIGVGEDASFDLSVIETYGAQVYAFDPTPQSISWVASQDWPPGFNFYPYGLAAENGLRSFHPPKNPDHVSHSLLDRNERGHESIEVEVRDIASLSKMVGKSTIDILKLDIEGAEYEVIQDLVTQKNVDIRQVLVEFHDFFPEICFRDTIRAIRHLMKAGYRIFHVSANGREYSFIKIVSDVTLS